MPKFEITTLGCKVNQAESAAISKEMAAACWQQTCNRQAADVCIINTCTVTRKASMQSRQAIRQAMRANPNARIVVTGCYAQTDPEAVGRIAGKDALIVRENKDRIAASICASVGRNQATGEPLEPAAEYLRPHGSATAAGAMRTRFFLKIQDGCNAHCTYCIVPRARGPSRSLPVADVLKQLADLAAEGYHEVVLAGIHLGHYGRDLQPSASLFELLQRIVSQSALERLRLSSIEPLELSEDILQLAAASSHVCQHFHIPLQSGDDSVLRRMGRPYTAERFRALVERIHALMPEAAIGADVLAGFPAETEQAHDNTCGLIAELPLSYLHVFPFSARPGTPAAGMPDQVHPEVRKARCRRLRNIGTGLRRAFYRRFLHREVRVLVESTRDRRTGLLRGFTANYLPVLLDAADACRNSFVDVRITTVSGSGLIGTLAGDNNHQHCGGGVHSAAQQP